MKLKFDRTQLAALLAVLPTDAAKLQLVKDDGIYIMSFDEPVKEEKGPRGIVRTIVYAKGYNPATDGDVWDKCRDAVGGDDFGECIGTKKEYDSIIADSVGDILLNVTATSISTSYIPKAPEPKVYKPFDVFKGSKSGKWRIVHSVKSDGAPILYNPMFSKKGEATAFVKNLKSDPSLKAKQDGIVENSHVKTAATVGGK